MPPVSVRVPCRVDRDTIVGQGTTGVVCTAGSDSPNILLHTGNLT
ncbi:hypothetical protein AB0K60_20480 [Thermopolyspora sp. NPDC052614]